VISREMFNKNLYTIILLSSKYELMAFKSKALYLKGLNSFNQSLLYCATAQLLEATVYSAMENDFQSLYEVYKIIGLSLYAQKQQNQSLIYFNLSENMLEKSLDSNVSKREELKYYKALCYFQLGQYVTAKRIIGGKKTEDPKLLELLNEIDMVLTA